MITGGSVPLPVATHPNIICRSLLSRRTRRGEFRAQVAGGAAEDVVRSGSGGVPGCWGDWNWSRRGRVEDGRFEIIALRVLRVREPVRRRLRWRELQQVPA